MRNPFKCLLRRKHKPAQAQKIEGSRNQEIFQVFDKELCDKLLSYGDKELSCTVIRAASKNAEKRLTPKQIIETFAHEFEALAFTQQGPYTVVKVPTPQHSICLVGLEVQAPSMNAPMKLLALQIREE